MHAIYKLTWPTMTEKTYRVFVTWQPQGHAEHRKCVLEIWNGERTLCGLQTTLLGVQSAILKFCLATTLTVMFMHHVSRRRVGGLLWMFEHFQPHEGLHHERTTLWLRIIHILKTSGLKRSILILDGTFEIYVHLHIFVQYLQNTIQKCTAQLIFTKSDFNSKYNS